MKCPGILIAFLLAAIPLAGCAGGTEGVTSSPDEPPAQAEARDQTGTQAKDNNDQEQDGTAAQVGTAGEREIITEGNSAQDAVDLTTVSGTIAYAEVYNMLTNPTTYAGTQVKLSGIYAAMQAMATGDTAPFVVVTDDIACCSIDLEVIVADGTDVVDESATGASASGTDAFPEEGKSMMIEGVFGYYTVGQSTFGCLVVTDISH